MNQCTGEIALFNINDIITSNNEPQNPASNQIWIDKNNLMFKQWNNSKWNVLSNWQPAIQDLNLKVNNNKENSERIRTDLTAIDNKYGLKITEIKSNYNELTNTTSSHKDEISKIKENIQQSESNFSNLSLEVNQIKLSVGSNKESIKTTDQKIDTLSKNVYTKMQVYNKSEIESSINVLKNQINLAVDGKYETKENSQTIIKKIADDAKSYTDTRISTVTNTINETKSNISLTVDSIREQVSSNTKTNKDIQTSIVNINGSINTINETIKTSSNKISETVSSLDSITTRVASSETKYKSLTESYSGLDNKISNVSTSLNNLSSNVYRKTETLTKSEVESKIKTATDSISLSVNDKFVTTTSITTTLNDYLNQAKAYANNIEKSSNSYTDNQIVEVNKTINSNQSAINIFKDSISSRVSRQEENISSINSSISNYSNRLSTAESKITPTAITNSISESLNNGQSITTTMTITDKDGFTVKHSDGNYTRLSGNGLMRYRNTGDVIGEYHYLFYRGSVSNVTSKSTVRIQLPDDFKGLDYGIGWWAGNIFPENNGDLIFSANAELVKQNKQEGWFEVKASLMVRNPKTESSPNWRGKMNIMYIAIA